jgi:hypothetical protein
VRELVGFDGTPVRVEVTGERVAATGSQAVAPQAVRVGR